MPPDVLSESYLDDARKEGDPPVDALVTRVLDPTGADGSAGRLDYNFMMDLADRIVATPSLRFVRDSQLNEELRRLPEDIREYFAPARAPAWVDPEKIALGARLWRRNTLAMLGVLYAYSLPACYLIARGIPALYKTAKLREPRYLSQRIYETGLMLDAVMGADGIRVIEDLTPGTGERTRYLWGHGYVTAKKVRFLHASMRYMLVRRARAHVDTPGTEPETLAESLDRETRGWDVDALGAPVNQEDLAYTLLTFGLALPKGLERWGCPVSHEEREAFLHLWRVVGHVMGIREDLLPESWEGGERLFAAIGRRQATGSSEGVALTDALIGFLSAYLPNHMGLSRRIAALMIIDQLGLADASKILDPADVRAAMRPDRRAIYALGRRCVRLYYAVRTLVLERFPTIASLFGNLLDDSAHQLIESWRGAYVRRPFDVPANSTEWKRKRGATESFVETLRAWRRKLFNGLALAVGLLFLAAFSLVALLPAWAFGTQTSVRATALVGVASALGALAAMKWRLPAIFAERPEPPA